MRSFFRALQGDQLPHGTRSELALRFGESNLEPLTQLGLFTPGPLARRYPCPHGGRACPRQVIRNYLNPDLPYLAVPPNMEGCCPSLSLSEAEVQTWRVSRRVLVAELARLFNISGSARLDEPLFPCAYHLGRAPWQGLAREVILCTDLLGSAPLIYLQSRLTLGIPTLVLAHARTRLMSLELQERFCVGVVQVIFLEDVVTLKGGALSLTLDSNALAHAEPMAPSVTSSPTPSVTPYCVFLSSSGERALSEAEYRALIADRERYELLLDLMSTTQGGRYRGYRRAGELHEEVSLTPQQAFAYAELMERREPLRAAELSALNSFGSPNKQVEAARRALDVKVSRYEWRSTHLLHGELPEAKPYLFRPPDGVWWGVIKVLDKHESIYVLLNKVIKSHQVGVCTNVKW